MLSLGSHWKAIHVDRDGRIVSSVTSLGGELLDVVTSQTVLAGSLPRQWPTTFDDAWVDEGVHEAQRSGYRPRAVLRAAARAARHVDARRALAYLIGVAIGSVMDTLLARRSFRAGTRVLVTGPPALAHAFAAQLQGTSVDAVPVSATQVARAVRTGMREVLARSAFAPSRPLSLVPPVWYRPRRRHGARRRRAVGGAQTIMIHTRFRLHTPCGRLRWRSPAVLDPGASPAAPAAERAPFAVAIRVDAAKSTGPLKPIWRFFGADEPNYAYMKDGRS